MKKCAIYKILNIHTGKCYVGSTNTPNRRPKDHFRKLKDQEHSSKKLQNSYNFHGRKTFVFEIVSIFYYSDLEQRWTMEELYIKKFDSYKNGYNMTEKACSPGLYIDWTEDKRKEMGKKVSQKHKGKIPKNLENIRELQRRPIIEFIDGKKSREYDSAKQAGEILGIEYCHINNQLRGITKQTKSLPGYIWKYKDGKPTRKIKKQGG